MMMIDGEIVSEITGSDFITREKALSDLRDTEHESATKEKTDRMLRRE
jgi:hypothetical protein